MRVIFTLVNRNLKLYIRNRTGVFFSFLSVLIIIMLYTFFLSDLQVKTIYNEFTANGINYVGNKEDIHWLINSWIMAGIISVNVVTITLAMLGRMVEDIESKISKDFLAAPIKRTQIILGYIASSWVLGIIISLLSLGLLEFFIVSKGGELMSFNTFIQAFLIIILSEISFSSILFFVITFIKTSSAFSTLSTLIGTLIGFLAGIYVPVGAFKGIINYIITFFPVTFSACMLRQLFMKDAAEKVFGSSQVTLNSIYEAYGVNLYFNDKQLSWAFMISVLIILAVIFYTLSIIRVSKNKLS